MIDLIFFIKSFLYRTKEHHLGAYSAAAAFFIMLSFLPFLMLLLSLIQYTPVSKADIMKLINEGLPNYVAPLLIPIVDEVFHKSVAIVSIAAVTAVWSASKSILWLIHGLNSINGITETRKYIHLRIRAIFYTVVSIFLIVTTLIFVVFGNWIHARLQEYVPVVAEVLNVVLDMRTLIALTMFTGFFLLLYKFIPNRKVSWKSRLPGAVFSALSWTVFSFGFSIYIDYFSNMSYMYGSLTTLVLVMLWLYFCMKLLMIGEEINCCYSEMCAVFRMHRKMKKIERQRA